jgi:hypothetical protein
MAVAITALVPFVSALSRCKDIEPSTELRSVAKDMMTWRTSIPAHAELKDFEKYASSALSSSRSAAFAAASKSLKAASLEVPAAAKRDLTINTYFHIVATDNTTAGGMLTDKMVTDQLAVMNEEYGPHGIKYVLKGVDRTINATWAKDDDDLGMKKKLRKGTYKDLNVYFKADLGDLLGLWSVYLPQNETFQSYLSVINYSWIPHI